MKVRYDKEADAIFIYLNETAQFKADRIINDNVILNLDTNGQVLGIELLHVSDFVTNPDQTEHVNLMRTVEQTPKS